jgi:hypothetical protein
MGGGVDVPTITRFYIAGLVGVWFQSRRIGTAAIFPAVIEVAVA